MGGLEYIDPQGSRLTEWMPKTNGTFRGEEGLLRLGLDFGAFSPGTIFKVAASREIGGFVEIDGVCADYPFSIRLAFSYGVAFFPETIGRFRMGHAQASDYSTPEKAEDFLDFIMREGEHLIRSVGCSRGAAEQIVDYTTWETFLKVAPPWLQSNESFVFRLTRKCLRASPRRGEWQNRARQHYPFLFWPLSWLTWPLFQQAGVRSRRLSGDGFAHNRIESRKDFLCRYRCSDANSIVSAFFYGQLCILKIRTGGADRVRRRVRNPLRQCVG